MTRFVPDLSERLRRRRPDGQRTQHVAWQKPVEAGRFIPPPAVIAQDVENAVDIVAMYRLGARPDLTGRLAAHGSCA
jgi:hypothetical protein